MGCKCSFGVFVFPPRVIRTFILMAERTGALKIRRREDLFLRKGNA